MSRQTKRGLLLIGLLFLPFAVGLLFTFEILKVNFPTDMANQPSVGYQEGPRKLPPDRSISFNGEPIVLDSLPINPITADPVSIQRGALLYSINCAMCHGVDGRGDGPLANYYESNPPTDLTSSYISFLFDGALYRTISQGFGQMPPFYENLLPRERWDVINFMRTLETE